MEEGGGGEVGEAQVEEGGGGEVGRDSNDRGAAVGDARVQQGVRGAESTRMQHLTLFESMLVLRSGCMTWISVYSSHEGEEDGG